MPAIVDEIRTLFEQSGSSMYAGEPVTQTEHALQAAELGWRAGASDVLVVAALLHDIGHLLHGLGEDIALEGVDDEHERLGAEWLAGSFPEGVSQPVLLHVMAKRYRCAVDNAYRDQLSAASRLSLQLQGGLYDCRVPLLLLENVRNMLYLDKGEAMRFLVEEIEALGYRWAYRLVDSRFTGTPQRRQRVIFLASQDLDPCSVLFADEAGEPPESHFKDNAFGFYWTEGLRGLGWARDATPTLKAGSTIGIPSPPAIWPLRSWAWRTSPS